MPSEPDDDDDAVERGRALECREASTSLDDCGDCTRSVRGGDERITLFSCEAEITRLERIGGDVIDVRSPTSRLAGRVGEGREGGDDCRARLGLVSAELTRARRGEVRTRETGEDDEIGSGPVPLDTVTLLATASSWPERLILALDDAALLGLGVDSVLGVPRRSSGACGLGVASVASEGRRATGPRFGVDSLASLGRRGATTGFSLGVPLPAAATGAAQSQTHDNRVEPNKWEGHHEEKITTK